VAVCGKFPASNGLFVWLRKRQFWQINRVNVLVKLPTQRAVAWFFLGAAVRFKSHIGHGVG